MFRLKIKQKPSKSTIDRPSRAILSGDYRSRLLHSWDIEKEFLTRQGGHDLKMSAAQQRHRFRPETKLLIEEHNRPSISIAPALSNPLVNLDLLFPGEGSLARVSKSSDMSTQTRL